MINRLATCEYITEYRNIFITGATGSGKTYMACAFGMEACKCYYSVRYVRLPDLLLDLQAARDNGTFSTVLKKYTNPIVLIIDEWLLLKLTEAEARNLFELIHKRRKKSSTIFCSQFRESEWYQQICDGESTLADAIMDRISYDSYKIDIIYKVVNWCLFYYISLILYFFYGSFRNASFFLWSSLRKARAVKEMSDYLLTHRYSEYTAWKKHCPYWVKGITEEEYFESIVEFVSTQGNFENALFVFYCLVT